MRLDQDGSDGSGSGERGSGGGGLDQDDGAPAAANDDRMQRAERALRQKLAEVDEMARRGDWVRAEVCVNADMNCAQLQLQVLDAAEEAAQCRRSTTTVSNAG